ncbi:hypothetical protein HDU92_007665, partial [Lobulomyces angularis]
SPLSKGVYKGRGKVFNTKMLRIQLNFEVENQRTKIEKECQNYKQHGCLTLHQLLIYRKTYEYEIERDGMPDTALDVMEYYPEHLDTFEYLHNDAELIIEQINSS